jgi:hypothetical protein
VFMPGIDRFVIVNSGGWEETVVAPGSTALTEGSPSAAQLAKIWLRVIRIWLFGLQKGKWHHFPISRDDVWPSEVADDQEVRTDEIFEAIDKAIGFYRFGIGSHRHSPVNVLMAASRLATHDSGPG